MFFNHKKYIGSYLGTDASSASYIPSSAGSHAWFGYLTRPVTVFEYKSGNYNKIDELSTGDQVDVSSFNEREDLDHFWTQIILKGKPAYVESSAVSKSKPTGSKDTYVSVGVGNPDDDYDLHATQACNVRQGPSTTTAKIGSLKKDQKVIVSTKDSRSSLSQDWTQIIFDGKEAYVYSDFLANSSSPSAQTPSTPAPQKSMVKAPPPIIDQIDKNAILAKEANVGVSNAVIIGIAVGSAALIATAIALIHNHNKIV